MSENKINLVVPKDYNGTPIEVVLREGRAFKQIDPKEQKIVNIIGNIDSPYRWLEKRLDLINQKQSNIIVNRDEKVIELTINETDYYQTSIKGSLKISNEIKVLGINSDKWWEPIKLSHFLKMHSSFFDDKSECAELVTSLKRFKAKIHQNIERTREENGSKTDNYSRLVDLDMQNKFTLNIPILKGLPSQKIEVELYAVVNDINVTLSLVSANVNEAIEEYKNKVIDEQLEYIRGIAPDIVIIEI